MFPLTGQYVKSLYGALIVTCHFATFYADSVAIMTDMLVMVQQVSSVLPINQLPYHSIYSSRSQIVEIDST